MRRSRRRALVLCLATPFVGFACTVLSPRPDPSRFFTLTPVADAPTDAAPLRGRALGVGPLTFPRYLDRAELVTRVGANEVRPAKFDYWAGSLAKQFEGALSQNLQTMLGPDSEQVYPWYPGSAPDLVVEIDVRQFERATDGQAHLVARWRIRKGPSGRIARAGETVLARSAADDPSSTAAALSDLLADFSREIAQAIRALPS